MRVMFCGHREVLEVQAVERWLCTVCAQLICEGATQFFFGGYGKFDSLCAKVMIRLKQENPHIRMVLVLPYLNRKMNDGMYDETVYPPLESVPPKVAIPRRNEWIVDQSDVVVAYVLHHCGGAAKTLASAERKHKRIVRYQ